MNIRKLGAPFLCIFIHSAMTFDQGDLFIQVNVNNMMVFSVVVAQLVLWVLNREYNCAVKNWENLNLCCQF